MSEFKNIIKNYWNYYLELESEFVETKKYVDFDIGNYATFSIEFLKLYQAICGEIDMIGKYLALIINPKINIKNQFSINQWWIEIQDNLKINNTISYYLNSQHQNVNIRRVKVYNYLMDQDYTPWKDFEVEKYKDSKGREKIRLKYGSKCPEWWTDYNKIKHQRMSKNTTGDINYKKACLKNVCESIAALYLLEIAVIELSGNKDQLESFYNSSLLFSKIEFVSSVDIEELFKD